MALVSCSAHRKKTAGKKKRRVDWIKFGGELPHVKRLTLLCQLPLVTRKTISDTHTHSRDCQLYKKKNKEKGNSLAVWWPPSFSSAVKPKRWWWCPSSFSSIPFRLHIPWFRYKKASRKSRTLLSIDTILNNNKNLRDAQLGLNSKRYDMVACHHHRPIPYIIYDVHKEQTTRYYSRAHNNIKTQFNFRCFAASPHRLRRTRMDPSRTCSTLCDVSHTLLLAKDVPKELHVFRNEAKSKAANVIIIDIKHACWAWYPPPPLKKMKYIFILKSRRKSEKEVCASLSVISQVNWEGSE